MKAKHKALEKVKNVNKYGIDRSTKKGRYKNMLRIMSDADNHFQK